jgi:AcrR family transcriptional regulator
MDSKRNKKYLSLLTTGKELFWKHGFRRVTIEEICRNSGVSKMTYYKYFPNKFELAKTVFRNVVDVGMKRFNDLMEAEIPVEEKIRNLILFKMANTKSISQEFLQDFYLGAEPELRRFVEETTAEAWNELLGKYRAAQEKGIFRDDFKPEFMLKVSYKLVEMFEDESLSKLYDNPQDMIMEFTNFVMYGISPYMNHEK